ncbi:unnamed protein product [Symbiodinium sp. CCMP2456]|nr:unnamed protein product [Symbiodinium sp. CCMP2456]
MQALYADDDADAVSAAELAANFMELDGHMPPMPQNSDSGPVQGAHSQRNAPETREVRGARPSVAPTRRSARIRGRGEQHCDLQSMWKTDARIASVFQGASKKGDANKSQSPATNCSAGDATDRTVACFGSCSSNGTS